MLFNSPAFVFFFLPLVFGIAHALGRGQKQVLLIAWLVAASLLFYAWWSPSYVLLLLISIAGNFAVGRAISIRAADGRTGHARALLTLGVAVNLLLLCYYKYAIFVLDTINTIAGTGWHLDPIILPLGISFFTFTQIAYLVDAFQGKAREYNPIHYALFVSYFPHLVAGPILHHREMMPQFATARMERLNYEDLAVGLTIFSIGLFKKVILADGVAPFANAAFGAASRGASLGLLEAWGGALAYTLQLYFDFSGYSDMAIGISRLFGINLPINFNSPYKARNIADFWRRWHITLSRFLRDYLYIPLGGSRKGPARRIVNLLVTMLLGGLWHGAAWTFVIWGALHGTFLALHHVLTSVLTRLPRARDLVNARLGGAIARLSTFIVVVVGWVFFRSDSVASALRMIDGMMGLHGLVLPAGWTEKLGVVGSALVRAGVTSADISDAFGGRNQIVAIAVLLGIAWFAPNTQEIMSRFRPGLEVYPAAQTRTRFVWRAGWAWLCLTSALGLWSILNLARVTDFLYWQF